MSFLVFIAAVVLFVIGCRLSAFFSGSETGFYRVSFLRLSIDAHTGDSVAARLMWYVQHPEYFVATTLVGNNIANYVTTLAIGLGAGAILDAEGAAVDVATTLLFAPAIFLFGELMPKNLYFRAPTTLLRRGLRKFDLCYRVFIPMSVPLVWMTRLIERVSGMTRHRMDFVLGRHRLIQVLSKGHEHGLLTAEQGQLIHGLLHEATLLPTDLMIPVDQIRGIASGTDRDAILDFARTNGLVNVPVFDQSSPENWTGYLRVLDLQLSTQPVSSLIKPLVTLAESSTRLEALLALREASASMAVLQNADGDTLGLLTERSLIRHFMHPAGAEAARKTPLAGGRAASQG
jgi:putative hemolysin